MTEDNNDDGFTLVQTKRAENTRGRGGRPARTRVPKPVVQPALGPGDSIGAGDSSIVLDVLRDLKVDGQNLADVAFERMRREVKWGVMQHRGEYYVYTLVPIWTEVG